MSRVSLHKAGPSNGPFSSGHLVVVAAILAVRTLIPALFVPVVTCSVSRTCLSSYLVLLWIIKLMSNVRFCYSFLPSSPVAYPPSLTQVRCVPPMLVKSRPVGSAHPSVSVFQLRLTPTSGLPVKEVCLWSLGCNSRPLLPPTHDPASILALSDPLVCVF